MTLPGDINGCQHNRAKQFPIFIVRIVQSRNMLPRHDEHVGGRLGVDIFKRNDLIAVAHNFGRDRSFNNPAKQATFHRKSLSRL